MPGKDFSGSVWARKQYSEQRVTVEQSVTLCLPHCKWVSYIKKQRCLHEALLVSNKLTLVYIKTQVRIKQLKEIRLWQRIYHVKWVVQRPFLMSDCFRSLGGRGTRSFKACDPVSGASVSKSGCWRPNFSFHLESAALLGWVSAERELSAEGVFPPRGHLQSLEIAWVAVTMGKAW